MVHSGLCRRAAGPATSTARRAGGSSYGCSHRHFSPGDTASASSRLDRISTASHCGAYQGTKHANTHTETDPCSIRDGGNAITHAESAYATYAYASSH